MPLNMSYKTKLRISWSVASLGFLIQSAADVLSFYHTKVLGFSPHGLLGPSIALVGFVSVLATYFTGWLSGDKRNDSPHQGTPQVSSGN
jgi:hypothetical protein